ncbi:MAG: hypothetical protein ACPG19_12970 [Saprospiraceae bacterium]
MKNNFTKQLLVKYLYHETTNAETLKVEEAMSDDWELQELFENLERSSRTLPKVTFSPKSTTIQNILGYSREKPAIEPYV